MFETVSAKPDFRKQEEAILKFWQERNIFRRSMEERKDGPTYVLFEGPPTANGRPGVHHVLARAFKDLFPRYRTMRGCYVLRRGGWDTHGLPVEIEVEKELGLEHKHQIEEYGIAQFNERCKASVFRYIRDWERLTERIAYWCDLEDAYITYTNPYIESVWWILKQYWDRNLIYQGFRIVPYCPRCGTPLSDHEVAQGYRENTPDPSVFVRFPLKKEPKTAFLVWTTTPWTLPANVAVAVHPDVMYAKVERETAGGEKEYLILARDLVKTVFPDEEVKIVGDYKGRELKGRQYRPLFTFLPLEKKAHRVVLGDFVTTEEGTGVVHQAPAFGAEDMQMAVENDLPMPMTVDESGCFIPQVTPWKGMFVKDADPLITADLKSRGLLLRSGTYLHTYPFCWRCDTPLLYYARSTWYIRTTQFRDRMTELNETINWYPEHIRSGRFGNWLANNVDWALGRERYWGTPLPVWECADCRHQEMVGSIQELTEKSGAKPEDLDLHRPYVDDLHWECPKCKGQMNRVPELIDCWFDSGAMPVAQWHYPFENEERFKQQFPADFISEAIDQTRGWFYSLHAISTLLFDSISYRNVICLGLMVDAEGRKMSKHKGNVVDPWEVLEAHGADAFRWYLYTASPPGLEKRFSVDLVGEVIRTFTLTLWNVYAFFITYAAIDGWQPDGALANLAVLGHPAGGRTGRAYNALDRWILSELHSLVRQITQAMETYDVLGATRPIETFVDRLSNWYLRRSRRRFWRSGGKGAEEDADKNAAYATLYECLVTLARLLAPSMPYLSEQLYRNLVIGVDPEAQESVHLATWPEYDRGMVDETLNEEMRRVLRWASLGHAARNKANRKVRQPLAEAAFAVTSAEDRRILDKYAELLADELNVKKVRPLDAAGEVVAYALNPLPSALGPRLGSLFPKIRAALLALDSEAAAALLMDGKGVTVNVDGKDVEAAPGEVEVRMTAREGFAVASDGGDLAALATEITPALAREGLAREFVRRVQDLRKTADLQISDRIRVTYTATSKLAEAVELHADYIRAETLAVELTAAAEAKGPHASADTFDGESLAIALEKAQGRMTERGARLA
jgi:isoleucyl-tRNA synthetase